MKDSPHNDVWGRARYNVRRAWRRVVAFVRRGQAWFASRRRRRPQHRTLDWTEEREQSRGRSLTLTRGAAWYGLLFLGTLLFTQVLRSRASNIFFWFVFLLFPLSLIYTVIARASLKAYLYTELSTVEKMQPCPYELRIINSSIFAYPFVEAVMRLPRKDAVRTSRKTVRLSLPPLATYSVANEVTFRFRGTYEIGVSCFYVYDFFRMIRVRVDVEEYHNVLVLPRRGIMDGGQAVAASDMSNQLTRSPYAFDRLEVLDVRDYRMGDALKDIHWKLSSKAEELLVRDYSSGASNQTIVYCDLSATYPTTPPEEETKDSRPLTRREKKQALAKAVEEQEAKHREKVRRRQKALEEGLLTTESIKEAGEGAMSNAARRLQAEAQAKEQAKADVEPALPVHRLARDEYYADMNEYCADGVVEMTIAIVLRELRAGNRCLLMWFDARAEMGAFGFELQEESDFEAIYHLFATAPLCASEGHSPLRLRQMLLDTQGVKQVFVSAALQEAEITALCHLPGLRGGGEFGSAELVYYNPEQRFAHPEARRVYLEGCRYMLAESGIDAIDGMTHLRMLKETAGKGDAT